MPSTSEFVFFDAFGTLIYLPVSVGEHYREIGSRHGLDMSATGLNDAFRRHWKTAPPRANTLHGPRLDDDKDWWRELVRGVIADAASKASFECLDFVAYFEDLYTHFAQSSVWSVFPEVPGVLASLKHLEIRLGVISNFDRRLYGILEGLDLARFFSCVVISSEVGADKPEPRIFEVALRQAGVAAKAAAHVGDEPERDWGAEAVGMEVYKFHRPDQNLAGLPDWLAARSSRENWLASQTELK